ncbi:MAG: GAF domain-containing protein [Anaerolineae bacterium]|nr:GAF domain-containing protein [Anaerolineae bacterium]
MRLPPQLHWIYHRLIQPSPDLPLDEQVKASVLVYILLTSVSIGLLIQIMSLFIFPAEVNMVDNVLAFTFASMMIIPYILSRTRYYQWGSILTIVIFTIAICAIAINGGWLYLYYLLFPIVVCGMLLSVRVTIFLVLFSNVAIVVIVLLTEPSAIYNALQVNFFLSYVSFMIVLAAYYQAQAGNRYRTELEEQVSNRTAELLAANHSLHQEVAERKQAEKAVKQARQISETLREANLALTRTLDLPVVLETLLEYLSRLIPYDSGNVMLLKNGSQIEVVAIRGYEAWANPADIYQLSFDFGEYRSFREIADNKRGILITDVNKYPDWVQRLDRAGGHIKGWLGIPLIAGGEVIGLYSLDKVEADFFNEEHLRLAEALAAQAAVAIQNARLFEQLEAGQEQLRQLTQQVVMVQEEERRRVSRELHDEAGQALTAMKYSLATILSHLSENGFQANGEAEMLKHVRAAVTLCETTMSQIRNLAHDLRPTALDDLGLSPALEGFCVDFAERTSLSILYQGVNTPILSDAANTTLYRFLQEALTNVAKHAQATKVEVNLGLDEIFVHLSVEDNGLGFNLEDGEKGDGREAGIGLTGMRERLQLVGGRLELQSCPGGGSSLTASVPW